MSNNLVAVAAHIRGVECDVEATHETDEQGAYGIITVTVVDTGEPLFNDDDTIDGHITQADLVRFAAQYARYGHLLPEEFERQTQTAEIIAFPTLTDDVQDAA